MEVHWSKYVLIDARQGQTARSMQKAPGFPCCFSFGLHVYRNGFASWAVRCLPLQGKEEALLK